ncbi:YnbE family lipoprotein [Sphingomonas ginkgonis]|uniref:YnbE family lipoprotein n=1 Tax=Sphingomonas ginkgonis TaxID=2315330 RepID=A0A429VDD8_9SPHN|nr:YnbE family lipoprotein [Sphingomonas ginkgonis]RST31891.1 YnbE family lipoprotein [Sphingomonas ginkgonis]
MNKLIRGGVAAAVLAPALAGCISVKTPEKPIEINLNVNIRQEVLVRLQRDVENLINSNPQAFPGATTPPATTTTPPSGGTNR